ncbi:MAG: glycosyltransferase family 2 protein [Bacteroidota bacterium]
MLSLVFWISLAIILYTYLGYGIILYLLVRIKRFFSKEEDTKIRENLPNVTFLVAAYNEQDYIEEKIANSLAFDYPKDKIQYFFVTDGSDDQTPQLIENYRLPADVFLQLFHRLERKGKIAAVNRVMPLVKTPIIIYTDANTDINKDAIRKIVRHYNDPKVGAVAGEKRIQLQEKEGANSAGEGLYWKYESALKKWDSELNSVVGAAGELFSIRTALYEEPPQDSIVEDFYMTMRIAAKGYKVAYEPDAYAVETASASVAEELKRKIRIAAGGFQSIVRLANLLNIFKYGLLTFQYVSHRVLRWTLAPLSLLLLFISSLILAQKGSTFHQLVFATQVAFYILALGGYVLEKQKLKLKIFFVPYYFCIMNYAVFRGFFRYLSGGQSVLWERAKRG